MSVYLIDYENVHAGGLAGVEDCTMEDEIILLYGNNTSTISMELHIQIANSKAKVQYHKIERTGKNYLDFQLSTIAGYLVGTTRQSEFVIVSKDSGFDAVLDFWNQQKMADRQLHFVRRESIAQIRDANVQPEEKKEKKKAAPKRRTLRAKNNNRKISSAHTAQITAAEAKDIKEEGDETQSAEAAKQTLKMQETSEIRRISEQAASESQSLPKPAAEKAEAKKSVSSKPAAEKNVAEKQTAEPAQAKTTPEMTEAVKKKIRAAVKGLELKPTDYTKIYKVCKKSSDKQDLHQNLVHSLKQEKGTQIYKSIVGIIF